MNNRAKSERQSPPRAATTFSWYPHSRWHESYEQAFRPLDERSGRINSVRPSWS
jgi:hypothetical protein